MDTNGDESLLDKVGVDKRYTPSRDEWELELGRLLVGERDYALIQLGITSYVDRIVERSHDPVVSSQNLEIALRHVVSAWKPHNVNASYLTFCLMDLLAAHQPPEGFAKILGFMQQGFYFPEIPLSQGGYGAGHDLHKKALLTLEYYYPTAHPGWREDPAFVSYLDVLENHLQDQRFCSYAIGRFVGLNIIGIQDIKVRSAIELNPDAIHEIVSFLSTRTRLASIESELSKVYTQCFLVGREAIERFEHVLSTLGISLMRSNDGPQLELKLPRGQGAITIDFAADDVIELLELGNDRGVERAKALAAAEYS
ncbi:MAG TPA: hypothetical protein VNO50_21135 [Pyrinomonadaceae bacterium]|nr:hypothetical protein [Pyrinomonadaceae bacterium]